MVLPGPLVKSMLQDLLGAVALCHDRNIVIKSIDAEKVCIISSICVAMFVHKSSSLAIYCHHKAVSRRMGAVGVRESLRK